MIGTISSDPTQRFDPELAGGTLDALATRSRRRVPRPRAPTARTIDEVTDNGGTT
jgi:hypothetical protein